MNVSHTWLQKYFSEKIPSPEKLADLFTFHSFEVEGIEKRGSGGTDSVLDLKILPDRAHYALSHRGVAQEIAALTGLKLTPPKKTSFQIEKTSRALQIEIAPTTVAFCPRYIGRVIENVTVEDSPLWLKEALETIGARSINTIVDATNFVMFDIGQPLHAFDADKVEGAITVRNATEGEKITLLDGREIALKASDAVIADQKGPLAVAGIKGGKRAEVTEATKNIIIEAANFNPSLVRKTATGIGIRNDSSKRFENGLSPEFAALGMDQVTELIKTLSPQAKIDEVVDLYSQKVPTRTISISPAFISNMLGATLAEAEIIDILTRLDISVEKLENKETKESELLLTIPFERLDIVIPADVVEEVGRIWGYEKIEGVLPPPMPETALQALNKTFYYCEKIRNFLTARGLSEVYLYTLTNKGQYEVTYPLASDKSFLRDNLTTGLSQALELNKQNAPLLGLSTIALFEIGKIFPKEGERTSLVVGIRYLLKKKGLLEADLLQELKESLFKELGVKEGSNAAAEVTIDPSGTIFELNLDALIEKLPEVASFDLEHKPLASIVYKPISPYPFVLRDIAVFVPEITTVEEVLSIIKEQAGSLLAREDLFDVFSKKMPDGVTKTSYAYHLVFLSHERTLSDADIAPLMEKIVKKMAELGWQVR